MMRAATIRRGHAQFTDSPAKLAWRLLTSVRFAVILIICIATAGMLGVLIPQIPAAIRGDDQAIAGWIIIQRDRFGPFTAALYRFGLFNIFGTFWFRGSVAVLVFAVAVCTYNRFPAIWRTIRHPQKRVPDAYLRNSRNAVRLETPPDPDALEHTLRKHHYHVERTIENGRTYLFADRFQWAQLATFVSHLALIILIAGALVTMLTGYERQLFIAKGESAPALSVGHANQMQVYVDDAIGKFDPQGRPLDYRSFLTIYKNGQEAKRCVATVNDPCIFDGYRLSQASFFGFGAALQVKDTSTGKVVYSETLQLSDQMPVPHVTVKDRTGQLLVSKDVLLNTSLGGAFLARLDLPGVDGGYVVGVQRDEQARQWKMIVLQGRQNPSDQARTVTLPTGGEGRVGDLTFAFTGLSALPAAVAADVPNSNEAPSGSLLAGAALFQMQNGIFGSSEASSGRAVPLPTGSGPPTLVITGLGPEPIRLEPGQSAVVGNYEYSFSGQVPFSGIQVKRDRGADFIWVGVILLVAGMVLTFHVPRRRVWAMLGPDGAYLAGLAGPLVGLREELAALGREAAGNTS